MCTETQVLYWQQKLMQDPKERLSGWKLNQHQVKHFLSNRLFICKSILAWLLSLLSAFGVYEIVCVEGIFVRRAGPLSSILSSAADLTAPLSPSVPMGLRIWTFTFRTQILTLAGMWGHRHTLYFQTTIVCEREVGCAKLTMWRVRTLLNWASLVSPYSEVTLSSQSAPQMSWALCQRPVKFICEVEVRGWGHLACWMPSYNNYTQMGSCTL